MSNENPEPNPYEQEFVDPSQVPTQPLSLVSLVPVNMMSGMASFPAGNMVLLRFETPVGSFVFFASPSKVKEYVLELAATAAKAESGIILPPGTRA